MLPTLQKIERLFGRPDVGFSFEDGKPITKGKNAAGRETPPNLIGKANRIARSEKFPSSFLQVIGEPDAPLSVSANAGMGGNELLNKSAMLVLVALAEQVTGKAALWIPEVVAEINPVKDMTKRRTFHVDGEDVRCSVEYVRISDNAALLTFAARI